MKDLTLTFAAIMLLGAGPAFADLGPIHFLFGEWAGEPVCQRVDPKGADVKYQAKAILGPGTTVGEREWAVGFISGKPVKGEGITVEDKKAIFKPTDDKTRFQIVIPTTYIGEVRGTLTVTGQNSVRFQADKISLFGGTEMDSPIAVDGTLAIVEGLMDVRININNIANRRKLSCSAKLKLPK
ncbi:MAG: hypothetical protein HY921_03680 [Elusimicrobia bacterium]|nr:hypothetical protein [Elusimicrobiota bacterium]